MDESVIDALKQRARLLHRAAQRNDPAALRRLRRLSALKALDSEALSTSVQRRHCLSVVARELGLNGWSHLRALLASPEADDFGTLLYPSSCAGGQNIWCASYDEAHAIRAEHGGYLLPYRHQLVIVDRVFIEDLGVDPDDADWTRIGRDWVRPHDRHARHRLTRAVLRARV